MRRHGLPAIGVVLGIAAFPAWSVGWTSPTLLLAMASWTCVATWAASRWVGIVPPDLQQIPEPEGKWAAVQSFQGLQAAANVARWRRVVVVLGLVAICLVWDRGADRRDRCEVRTESRVEIRSAISAGVDGGLEEAGTGRLERERIGRAVASAVADELPPPDC